MKTFRPSRWFGSLALVAGATLNACGSSSTGSDASNDGASVDVAVDVVAADARDVPTDRVRGGSDPPIDVPVDVPVESAVEAAVDAAVDVPADVAVDAPAEASADDAMDDAPDAAIDAGAMDASDDAATADVFDAADTGVDVPADVPTGPLVQGRVMLQGGTAPAANVLVRIGARTTMTDASGQFALNADSVPYDIEVGGRLANGRADGGTFVLGLTRLDPTVYLPFDDQIIRNSNGFLTGSVSGVTLPLPANAQGQVYSSVGPYIAGLGNDGTFSLVSYWRNGDTAPGKIFAFVWSGNGAPQTVLGFGSVDVTFTNGATNPLPGPIPLTVPASTTFTGMVTLVDNVDRWVRPEIHLGGEATLKLYWGYYGGNAGTFTYTLPDLPGTTMDAVISTNPNGGRRSFAVVPNIPLHATLPDITVPTAVQQASPANGATGVALTDSLVATPGTTDPQVFTFTVSIQGNVIRVVTTATSTPLPDFSALGLPTPNSGSTAYWTVNAYPGTSVDDAAGAVDLTVPTQAGTPGGVYLWSTSDSRSFTVQ